MSEIEKYNDRERAAFLRSIDCDTYEKGGGKDADTAIRRSTFSLSAEDVLNRSFDLVLGLWLPHTFASYANELIDQSLKDAGLWIEGQDQALVHVENARVEPENNDQDDKSKEEGGAYYWRVNNVVMWQQLDRRIDE